MEAELTKIRRYEFIRSIMVTSNLPFRRWGETFADDVVAAAMIDQLVHHAEVLTGDSYRTRRQLPAKDRNRLRINANPSP